MASILIHIIIWLNHVFLFSILLSSSRKTRWNPPARPLHQTGSVPPRFASALPRHAQREGALEPRASAGDFTIENEGDPIR